MPSTSSRLYGPALIATGPATVLTCPASTKYEITQIHISNPSASPVTWTMSIGADAAGTRLFSAYSIPAAAAGTINSIQDYFFNRLVMTAAEIMQLSAGTNNILTVTIMGYTVTL